MAKVVCVLYDDPITGYPTAYARDDLPRIDHYPGGQTLPTPRAIDFQPGVMLGMRVRRAGLAEVPERASTGSFPPYPLARRKP